MKSKIYIKNITFQKVMYQNRFLEKSYRTAQIIHSKKGIQ